MRKSLNTVLAFVIACSVFAFGCACEESAYDPQAQWVTIQGQHHSLSLPASFKGGDPADPAVMSVLRGIAESRSNPEERESLVEWLDVVQAGVDLGDSPSLMAWAAPDDGGSIVSVTVTWSLLQGLVALSDGDSSMRSLVYAYMYPYLETEWKLDSLAAREASVSVRFEESDDVPAEFIVIKAFTDYYCIIRYSCQEESWDAFYSIFKRSSETLLLR